MYKDINRGFTLIELLIVIAIIGVLAATVVVSLGSKTDDAKGNTVKIGISSIRTLASTEVASGIPGGENVCNRIYSKISADKEKWPWKGTALAAIVDDANTDADETATATDGACNPREGGRESIYDGAGGLVGGRLPGDMCCASDASHNWVVWGLLPGADGGASGKTGKDVYCADSKQFLGDLDMSVATNLKNDQHRCQGDDQ